MSDPSATRTRLFGRSSSHFTRVARIFASELGVEYSFQIVHDLLSQKVGDFGGNPALRVPVLQVSGDTWFGALNVCRGLSHASKQNVRVVWPEDLRQPLLANALELILEGMATEVTLVMSKLAAAGESPPRAKLTLSLTNVIAWLEDNVSDMVTRLPADRDLSYIEVALFCFVSHVKFRDVIPVSGYPRLAAFMVRFGERESARETAYAFDS